MSLCPTVVESNDVKQIQRPKKEGQKMNRAINGVTGVDETPELLEKVALFIAKAVSELAYSGNEGQPVDFFEEVNQSFLTGITAFVTQIPEYIEGGKERRKSRILFLTNKGATLLVGPTGCNINDGNNGVGTIIGRWRKRS